MAKKQIWTVKTDDGVHTLAYSYSIWSGKSDITIDGEEFVQKMRSFRVNVARREIFRLGDEQCVLAVSGNGRAEVIYRGKTVPEGTDKENRKTPERSAETPEKTPAGKR